MYEIDILVSLASLAGERMFFEGDSSAWRQRRPAHRDVLRDDDGERAAAWATRSLSSR